MIIIDFIFVFVIYDKWDWTLLVSFYCDLCCQFSFFIRYSLVEYRWIVQSKKPNCLIEISLIKLNSYIYTLRFLLYCLIWFIFHYYYYLRVLKSSLYLSSRPLVSLRVAANTHTHTRACSCWFRWFMVLNHLFHNCDLFLPWIYEYFSSFSTIYCYLMRFMPYVYIHVCVYI